MRRQNFIQNLVDPGQLHPDKARNLEKRFNGNSLSILSQLLSDGSIPRHTLCQTYANSLGTAYVNLHQTLIQPDVATLLPLQFASSHQIIPLYRLDNTITVATSDPLNLTTIDDTTQILGTHVAPVFSPPDEILEAIEIHFASLSIVQELESTLSQKKETTSPPNPSSQHLIQLAEDNDVVTLTRNLLLVAVRERASDIHLEPEENGIRIRLRIDGELQEWQHLHQNLKAPVTARLKLMAGCDIAEHRRPQDGRLSLPLGIQKIDLRFSSVPTMEGEKIVLRILGSSNRNSVPQLEELNLSSSNLKALKKVVTSPNGVFFVTGPTGSGKTTTLYSILQHINRPGLNILTIEDPVEYRLPGITQVQVNNAVDLSFATALRAFLRQDPNVILVGEVRDMETARIASQAALTGHLVMSTMHTNNALQAVTRLVEIGVEPFLVAPSIIGVSAQRLVRRLCPQCREPQPMPPDLASKLFGPITTTPPNLWQAKGCPSCRGTGFKGRIAIQEIFILTEAIRQLIARNSSILDIQRLAKDQGFQGMEYDGLKKALRGLTTLQEVEKAIALAE